MFQPAAAFVLVLSWLLVLGATAAGATDAAAVTPAADQEALHCHSLLQELLARQASTEPAPYTGNNMVFFLHIPRTAGRTFFSCLLNQGTPANKRCNKQYDQHINGTYSLPDCYMLSSHDDYSVMSSLPPNTAVVSQLRDPVQRVLSAYEFAIEGAAIQTARAQARRQGRTSQHKPSPQNRTMPAVNGTRAPPGGRNATKGAHTKDVWPWSHLIPFFAADISLKLTALGTKPTPQGETGVWSEQRAADGTRYYYNAKTNTSQWELSEEEQKSLAPNLDAYNNDLVMPLQEFIRSPIAAELLHNGEFLQVLGLTNYSSWSKAAAMRSCIAKHKDIADELLEVALRRIEGFTHVGTLERLNSSVEAAAASLGMPFNGTAHVKVVQRNRTANTPATGQGGVAASAWQVGVTAKLHHLWTQALQVLAPWSGRDNSNKLQQGQPQDGEGAGQAGPAGLAAPGAEDAGEQAAVARRRQLKAAEGPEAGGPEADATAENKTANVTLARAYHVCVANARRKNRGIKDNSLVHLRLEDRRQVYFDKEDRRTIPQELLDEIRELNALDVKLYERAQELLERSRQHLADAGVLQLLPDPAAAADDEDDDYEDVEDDEEGGEEEEYEEGYGGDSSGVDVDLDWEGNEEAPEPDA